MQLASGSLGVCGSWHTPTKFFGNSPTHAMDQIVALPRPVEAGAGVADVMRHRRRARREDRDVGAAIALELQLGLDALAQLVVGDLDADPAQASRIVQPGDLRVAECLELFRGSGVVPVAIDDHEQSSILR